jgi:energy-coupling factor transporter ATP-binding protein EcfA2
MIESINFKKDDSNTNYGYVNRLPSIEKLNGKIEFKPGLNIIVGPNGSGKSSILKSIANHLCANQSGYSVVTKKWLQDIDWDCENSEIESIVSPVDVKHDGQPIVFGDPRRRLGLTNGGIDEEFYGDGLLEHMNMSQESSGEQNNRRITPYLEILQGKMKFPTNFVDAIGVNNINSL